MALKVFNFKCKNGHLFEAMIPSVKEFEKQRDAGLFLCPFCECREVERVLSAPLVARSRSTSVSASEKEAQERLENLIKEVAEQINSAEDVGEKFAAEARAIHYGDSPERSIRGTAKTEEVIELIEEGVPIVPLGVKNDRKVN